jgi:hypothetical protein
LFSEDVVRKNIMSEERECIITETINFIDWKDCFSNVEKCYNIGRVNNKK